MSLTIARGIFKNMPDEVFNMYIAPLIALRGWPFTSVHEYAGNSIWFQYFHEHSIKAIAELRWKRCEIPLSQIRLHWLSVNVQKDLTCCHLFGIQNHFEHWSGSKEKFLLFRELSGQSRRVPAPVVLMMDNEVYCVLDGNHRFAAFASLPNISDLVLDCWVGS